MISRRSFLTKMSALLGLGLIGNKVNSKELNAEEIIKAWENPEYRASLTEAQWNALPENPAGSVDNAEFSGDLAQVSGNSCSGDSCSGNSCSGDSCSGNSCSGDSCSGNSCSGNSCSGNSCSGNSCSSYSCGG